RAARTVARRIRSAVLATEQCRCPRASALARVAAPAHAGTGDMTAAEKELLAAWRAVANAKLTAFREQCWRLAALVRQGLVDRTAAADRLWEIAIAHALVRALGEDRIEAILAEAFADADFRAMHSEVA